MIHCKECGRKPYQIDAMVEEAANIICDVEDLAKELDTYNPATGLFICDDCNTGPELPEDMDELGDEL